MFEVGFTELLLIFGLALVVLGPEKLPRVAAQVGRWIGRAKSMARQFREQLEDEAILVDEPPKKKRPAATSPAPSATASPDPNPTAETSSTAVPDPGYAAAAADSAPDPQPPKYYQPDDDTQRSDVSHADAGAESHERGV